MSADLDPQAAGSAAEAAAKPGAGSAAGSAAEAAARLLPAVLAACGRVAAPAGPVVLVDGGSGAGKTTLAAALVAAWPGGSRAVSLLHLEDVYPGWDGLAAASAHLREHVLTPRRRGERARWQRWDWATGAPAGWHDVDPARALVVEGSGSLSRANRALAAFGVWVQVPAVVRKGRALARDGETYAPHWDRWAAQEAAFAASEQPRLLADRVVRWG